MLMAHWLITSNSCTILTFPCPELEASTIAHLLTLFLLYFSRDAIRDGCTDNELLEVIGAAVNRKKRKHAGIVLAP